MRQVAQNYRSGELSLVDVPAPTWRPGGVVVRSRYSLISLGTERMKVEQSKMSLLGMARARPDQVKQVMDSVAQQGLMATYRKVSDRLDSLTPLGYSLSGVVTESGEGAEDLPEGTRVACGGNQYAFHAEYNWVPHNLCVPIPDAVSDQEAAFTTVGSIALQAVRQSEAVVGETAVVIGLGLVGQLIIRILSAAGIHSVGIDPSPARCALAESGGSVIAAAPQSAPVLDTLDAITDGAGADHVFLAASTSSNEPTESAAALARDRGRVIDVGNTRLDLPWKDYYEKELDVRFSRSYGPGRYDPTYEEGGIDYPIGYVRWTERRNMKAFLELMRDKRLDVTPLIGETAAFEDAVDVYTRIHEGSLDAVGVLFTYPATTAAEDRVLEKPGSRTPEVHLAPTAPRFGCIGAGNYASSMLLPHLAERGDVEMTAVATATALSAANAQSRFGFQRMTTDAAAVLEDPEVTCFMILTRHDSHAHFVTEALRKQKPVYVEKPLALDRSELDSVVTAAFESQNQRLFVGYNRRFSPLLGDLRARWGEAGPVQVSYHVNAGRLADGSWYADRGAQGSRFVGEGGHFVDTISWWIGEDPETVTAVAGGADPDDLQVLLTYPDGSIGHIAYLTQGDARFPKERMTVSGGNQIALMDNFSGGQLWRNGKKQRVGNLGRTDKGQGAEMAALVRVLKHGGELPIAFRSLVATSAATMAAVESARIGGPVAVADFIPAAPSTGESGG